MSERRVLEYRSPVSTRTSWDPDLVWTLVFLSLIPISFVVTCLALAAFAF